MTYRSLRDNFTITPRLPSPSPYFLKESKGNAPSLNKNHCIQQDWRVMFLVINLKDLRY
uniref:Uncharacterized protein n=1 Tax=Solanum tuberosum TaxID=4113 RepID=M1A750_SOLTU